MDLPVVPSEVDPSQPNSFIPFSAPAPYRFAVTSALSGRKRGLGQGHHDFVNDGKTRRLDEVNAQRRNALPLELRDVGTQETYMVDSMSEANARIQLAARARAVEAAGRAGLAALDTRLQLMMQANGNLLVPNAQAYPRTQHASTSSIRYATPSGHPPPVAAQHEPVSSYTNYSLPMDDVDFTEYEYDTPSNAPAPTYTTGQVVVYQAPPVSNMYPTYPGPPVPINTRLSPTPSAPSTLVTRPADCAGNSYDTCLASVPSPVCCFICISYSDASARFAVSSARGASGYRTPIASGSAPPSASHAQLDVFSNVEHRVYPQPVRSSQFPQSSSTNQPSHANTVDVDIDMDQYKQVRPGSLGKNHHSPLANKSPGLTGQLQTRLSAGNLHCSFNNNPLDHSGRLQRRVWVASSMAHHIPTSVNPVPHASSLPDPPASRVPMPTEPGTLPSEDHTATEPGEGDAPFFESSTKGKAYRVPSPVFPAAEPSGGPSGFMSSQFAALLLQQFKQLNKSLQSIVDENRQSQAALTAELRDIRSQIAAIETTSAKTGKCADKNDEMEVEEELGRITNEDDQSSDNKVTQLPTRRRHRRQMTKPAALRDPALKPGLTNLQHWVRTHLDTLFGVTAVAEVLKKNPPITDEEMQSYMDDEGEVTCTIQNFRVDFTRPPLCTFNAEARSIFVENFLACHRAGHFKDKPIPNTFLAPLMVSSVYDTHMEHRRKTYKAHMKPLSLEDAQLYKKRKAANSRRRTVHALMIF
ncbi:uncharacterized protein B0H18DRAFT_951873 [Fomitopsis serialis]|uniref:uncharacterized protein n=1 Tax=Fomitopsis serialis TaxID=139415 RepID=UPI0020084F27|nr:uncharacterized protein B0H18DRAFT_951873 [Neoantrodia serialis]KAH9933282.1 hypothetical protein B0H18DRAFT_951873 [Neoantrodia serialis]